MGKMGWNKNILISAVSWVWENISWPGCLFSCIPFWLPQQLKMFLASINCVLTHLEVKPPVSLTDCLNSYQIISVSLLERQKRMGKHRVMIFIPLGGKWSRGRKCLGLGFAGWWQSRTGHKSSFLLSSSYSHFWYVHPTLGLSFSKIRHKYPSNANCILWDIQIQEMSSQLSVLMEDLQNPIQHLEVCEWHFWVSLSREEDGVFVNEVSLEVYRKIQSGPGKPSFAGTSIFLCLQWSEFHYFAHHKSHSDLSGKGHRQTHVWLLPHVSSENAVIF